MYKKITEKINIEESVTVTKETAAYLFFYKEFYKNFLQLDDGQDKIILSGLFLHLTFESLITYIIRNIIIVVYKNQRKDLANLWYEIFETEKLDKKLEFLQQGILNKDKIVITHVKKVVSFYQNKLSPLRNKIVHGHQISLVRHNDEKIVKSKLAELLTEDNIQNLYKEFWKNLDLFLNLLNKINIPEHVNLDKNYIKDVIESTKRGLKKCEELTK